MKKFFYKLILLILIICLLQGLIFFYFPFELPQNVIRIKEIIKKKPEIVFFGDSTSFYLSPNDSDQRTIAEFLSALTPGITIDQILNPGYELDIYLAFCEYMVKNKYYPETLIIPINLRSFGVEWSKNPRYEFQKIKLFLKNDHFFFYMFIKPMSIFKLAKQNYKDLHNFMNTPVYRNGKAIGRVKDFDYTKYRRYKDDVQSLKGAISEDYEERFNFIYLYELSEDHPKLTSLKKIIRICQRNHIKLVLYISPIDFEHGLMYSKTNPLPRIKENISVIKSLALKEHEKIIDLSFSLDSSYFPWEEDGSTLFVLNGHLTSSGRAFIAKQIYNHLLKSDE